MKQRILTPSILCLIAGSLGATDDPKHNAKPGTDGVVPNEASAIKIAVAAWEPVYGADLIAAEKPFRATLADGVWTVQGSLPKGGKGGVALAEITQEEGRILRLCHGK